VVAETRPFFDRDVTVNRLRYAGGAAPTAGFLPASPVDLSGFDELRVWIQAGRAADGSVKQPFYLAFSFDDGHDLRSDQHRWFVPSTPRVSGNNV
jgi:hypothetical protein